MPAAINIRSSIPSSTFPFPLTSFLSRRETKRDQRHTLSKYVILN
jgi:hypothetical protein